MIATSGSAPLGRGAKDGVSSGPRPATARMPAESSGATTPPSTMLASMIVHGSFSYRSMALSTIR